MLYFCFQLNEPSVLQPYKAGLANDFFPTSFNGHVFVYCFLGRAEVADGEEEEGRTVFMDYEDLPTPMRRVACMRWLRAHFLPDRRHFISMMPWDEHSLQVGLWHAARAQPVRVVRLDQIRNMDHCIISENRQVFRAGKRLLTYIRIQLVTLQAFFVRFYTSNKHRSTTISIAPSNGGTEQKTGRGSIRTGKQIITSIILVFTRPEYDLVAGSRCSPWTAGSST